MSSFILSHALARRCDHYLCLNIHVVRLLFQIIDPCTKPHAAIFLQRLNGCQAPPLVQVPPDRLYLLLGVFRIRVPVALPGPFF